MFCFPLMFVPTTMLGTCNASGTTENKTQRNVFESNAHTMYLKAEHYIRCSSLHVKYYRSNPNS